MKNLFLDFVDQAYKRNVCVNLDCSEIPPCYFSATELFLISKVTHGKMDSLGHCGPTYQVMPDMSISCCFGDNEFKKQKKTIFDFETLNDIKNYYRNKRNSRIDSCYHLNRCDECILKSKHLCYAGCFGFINNLQH